MHHLTRIRLSVLPLALCLLAATANGQGRSADKPKDNRGRAEQGSPPREADRAKPQANRGRDDAQANRGRDEAARSADRSASKARNDNDNRANRGNSSTAPRPSAVAVERASDNARFKRTWTGSDVRPDLRRYVWSNRPAESITAGALAHAHARKVRENAFVMTPAGRQMLVRNRKGDVLVALDDDRARNLGAWRVKPVEDRAGEGAPSFCRSGAGHPNWGRQWCIDKGFGLGSGNDTRWGRNLDLNDVTFLSEPTSATLTRAALAAVLGERAVDRLALHAITLGLVDPLVGTWRTDPAGPRVLMVNSGAYPVAEIVDVNGDKRSDRMVVALRPW